MKRVILILVFLLTFGTVQADMGPIDTFVGQCAGDGVDFGLTVLYEVNVHFFVIDGPRDSQILWSTCPGCTGFNKYSTHVKTDSPEGNWTITTDPGRDSVTISVQCEQTTAVGLTSLTAKSQGE
jgi:hypothetical protein